MNAPIEDLIQAIVSQVMEKGGYVTKTKLLKLLYLFDVEYYRNHRKTFTGFTWKFFHLGPWAREFDPIVEGMLHNHVLQESVSTKPDYDTKFFRVIEPRSTNGLFPTFADEAVLRSVLNTWSESATGEILDYVYFHTEPMEKGIRNELLDFNCIGQDKPEKYVRPKSTASEKDISKLRRAFRERFDKAKSGEVNFQFTAPRYDEEFEKAIQKIEAADH